MGATKETESLQVVISASSSNDFPTKPVHLLSPNYDYISLYTSRSGHGQCPSDNFLSLSGDWRSLPGAKARLSEFYGSVKVGGCLAAEPPKVTTVPSVHFRAIGAGREDLRWLAGEVSAATQQVPILPYATAACFIARSTPEAESRIWY